VMAIIISGQVGRVARVDTSSGISEPQIEISALAFNFT
jgi:hypothetical protein